MRVVKVFPDYMSSGLWENGANIDESRIAHCVAPILMLALRQWHEIWEFLIGDDVYLQEVSLKYRKQWWKDGQHIVGLMNSAQKEFNFIYDVEEPC